jgi:hypothetical protein
MNPIRESKPQIEDMPPIRMRKQKEIIINGKVYKIALETLPKK